MAEPPPTRFSPVAPIEPDYHRLMNDLAPQLDAIFNPDRPNADRKTGFALLVFPLDGAPGTLNFIANGRREDMIEAMREIVALADRQADRREPT